MARYVFFNIPAFGHLNPTIRLLRRMIANGDEIICYNDPDFRVHVERTGAIFRPYPVKTSFDFQAFTRNGFLGFQQLAAYARKVLPDLIDDVRSLSPDCIIYDSSCIWWGNITANSLNLPQVVSSAMFLPSSKPRLLQPRKTVIPFIKLISSAIFPVLLTIRDHIAMQFRYGSNLMLGNHLPPPKRSLHITYTSSYLQPFSADFDELYKFIGPGFDPEFQAGKLDFELTGKRFIYISLGTILSTGQYEFYRTCFEAFGDKEVDVLLSVGKESDISQLGGVPDNFIVRNFVPQLEVLKKADLFITHGGMNGLHEALYYGVPLLMIPASFEQFLNVLRVEELKGGVYLKSKGLRPQKLSEAAFQVLDSEDIKAGIEKIRNSLHESGGVELAIKSIEDFMSIRIRRQ